jgi:hypothetical protein
MKPGVRFRIRNEPALTTALTDLLRGASWNPDGSRTYANWATMLEHRGTHQILNAAVENDGAAPDLIQRRIVNVALRLWYCAGAEVSVAAFEAALQMATDEFWANAQPLSVVTLMNVRLETPPQKFEVTDLVTHVGDWAMAPTALSDVWRRAAEYWGPDRLPRWLHQHGGGWIPDPAFTMAMTAVPLGDVVSAVETASEALDLIRAFLNAPMAFRTGLRWTHLPTPLGRIVPSPVYAVFNEGGQLLDTVFGLQTLHDLSAADVSDAAATSTRKLLADLFGPSSQKTTALKVQLLRLYQSALDATDPQAQFLAFWQVVEAATLTEPGSGEKVEGRLGTLLGTHGDAVARQLARSLTALRNDLVHQGVYPANDSELLFVLKSVADRAFRRAYSLVENLGGVEELKDYFHLASRGNAALHRHIRVAEYVLAQRSPPSHRDGPKDPHTM